MTCPSTVWLTIWQHELSWAQTQETSLEIIKCCCYWKFYFFSYTIIFYSFSWFFYSLLSLFFFLFSKVLSAVFLLFSFFYFLKFCQQSSLMFIQMPATSRSHLAFPQKKSIQRQLNTNSWVPMIAYTITFNLDISKFCHDVRYEQFGLIKIKFLYKRRH